MVHGAFIGGNSRTDNYRRVYYDNRLGSLIFFFPVEVNAVLGLSSGSGAATPRMTVIVNRNPWVVYTGQGSSHTYLQ